MPGEVTRILSRLSGGDDAAADELLPLVHDELRRLAAHLFASQPTRHTLQPTALVNEAYIRLVGASDATYAGRAHFMAVAARAMRQILIDHARRTRAAKRGGGARVSLPDDVADNSGPDIDLLALDEALERLRLLDERKARVVEMRFFTGLSIEETAAALDIARATVAEDWRFARAWLAKALGADAPT